MPTLYDPRIAQLVASAEQLTELCNHVHGLFGCGIVSASTPIRPHSFWEFVVNRASRGPDLIDYQSCWPEPIDDQTCIRWWGDKIIAAKFKEWGNTAHALFSQRDFGALSYPTGRGNYVTAICFLFEASSTASSLSQLIQERQFLDVQSVEDDDPAQLLTLPGSEPPVFVIREPVGEITKFVVKAIHQLFDKTSEATLFVDVGTNRITFKGETEKLERTYILILDSLRSAKGHVVSRNELRQIEELQDEERLDRIVKKIRRDYPELGQLIETVKGKGYRIDAKYCS